MTPLLSAIRRLPLQLAAILGHTVRIANVLPGLAGAAMASWGVAMIYTPAGWITGGIALLAFGREINAVPARAAGRQAE